MDEDLNLTDLVDVEILQRIQDSFSRMTGIAALTTDRDGVPVTEGSNFTDFCTRYTRQSEVGCKRCEECDRLGAELALERGKSVTYPCHAGLFDFAAPIMAHDQMDRAAEFLYTIAGVLSDIAYSRYITFHANQVIERAANMKSDFLANMSHEIRTPMNAVIGMAEMALREELPPAAREYITQIKSSGKALLTIINDILDFSKIESGKLDICPVEYEPMSIIYDVSNIIMTRIGDKNVELIFDIAPDIPYKLFGDNIRIKQIIVNLANNAVKFTQTGQVLLKMDFERLSDERITLKVWVQDTGIGIRKEDLGKLFQSFQQVDSKRNRNIEGTGLGLAISKRLLELMDGEIAVESEYEKGSTFSFVLPQTVLDDTPSIMVKECSNVLVADFMKNVYESSQLKRDCKRSGAQYLLLGSEEELYQIREREEKVYLFIEQRDLTPEVERFIKENPEITAVLLVGFNVNLEYPMDNLLIMKKPVYLLNLAQLFNHEETHFGMEHEEADFEFIAPEAEVLIVDDNAINLTVAEGLLEPLKMKIDTALSGKEAIGKISVRKYDIILMDHMMPELDGVETTHIIRRFHEEYENIPIIALTANAVDGTKEMFLKEGMNDFVAKPIELRVLVAKMKQWLPPGKIKKVTHETGERVDGVVEIPEIGDLDTAYSIKLLGSEKLFWSVLQDYYRVIEKKAILIKELEQNEDWPAYTIQVHALKSASKQIGAMALSGIAAEMEKAGNERNAVKIHANTNAMLEKYLSYVPLLAPYCKEKKTESKRKEHITEEIRNTLFEDMREALENLDMDYMEDVIAQLKKYQYQEWESALLEELADAVEDIDVDACERILSQWEKHL